MSVPPRLRPAGRGAPSSAAAADVEQLVMEAVRPLVKDCSTRTFQASSKTWYGARSNG